MSEQLYPIRKWIFQVDSPRGTVGFVDARGDAISLEAACAGAFVGTVFEALVEAAKRGEHAAWPESPTGWFCLQVSIGVVENVA